LLERQVGKVKQEHIVVVGAHALDAELMAGGIVSRFTAAGAKATLIHLTRGERGHPTKGPEVFARQLEEEMAQAARVLGAQELWLGYPAGCVDGGSPEQLDKLAATFEELAPTWIITHWRGSWHPRHVATHDLVRGAAKEYARRAASLRGLFYGENCEDLAGFQPQLYVELSQRDVEKWLAAAAKYELFRLSCSPETEGIPYNSYYRAAAKVRGLECGAQYAQALMVESRFLPLAGRERLCL
jgi:LmbE family N-acetylglucosaminyl deacetylase